MINLFDLFDFNHVLGKLIAIVLIIIAAHFHILAGVLVLLFIISMNHYVIEGMENNQQKDGSIVIPEVLRPYMGGLKKIEVKK
jgi:hypothetical protein